MESQGVLREARPGWADYFEAIPVDVQLLRLVSFDSPQFGRKLAVRSGIDFVVPVALLHVRQVHKHLQPTPGVYIPMKVCCAVVAIPPVSAKKSSRIKETRGCNR